MIPTARRSCRTGLAGRSLRREAPVEVLDREPIGAERRRVHGHGLHDGPPEPGATAPLHRTTHPVREDRLDASPEGAGSRAA
jgi:hypothetical protein